MPAPPPELNDRPVDPDTIALRWGSGKRGTRRLLTYGLATAGPVATVWVLHTFGFGAENAPPIILFLLPVLLSAAQGGNRAGLAATAIGAFLANYYLLPPVRSFSIQAGIDSGQWLMLIATGVFTSQLFGWLRRPRPPRRVGRQPREFFTTERKVQGSFVFALACIGVIGVVSYTGVSRLQGDANRVRHSQDVIASLRAVLAMISAAEGAQRGHTITGDESYLDSYQNEQANIDRELERLGHLVANEPEQRARWEELAPLVSSRLAVCRQIAEIRRSQGFAAAQTATTAAVERNFHERVRLALAGMEEAETALLIKSEQNALHSAGLARMVIVGGSGIAFAFVSVALFAIGREFAGRRRGDAALREAHEQLESRVRARTAELAQASEHLQLGEARLAGIVNSAMDAIVSVNAEQKIVLFNTAAERMFRCPAAEVIGQSLERFIPHRFRGTHRHHVSDFSATGVTTRSMRSLGALSGIRADGEEFPIEASISQIELEGQKLFTVILRDITERKRTEEALTVSLKEIGALNAALDEHAIVAMTDAQGKITYVNDRFCRISQYSREELLGQDHRIINSGHHAKDFIRSLWTTVARGQVWHGEIKNRAKDGSFYWVDTTIVPFFNEQGKPRQYVAIRADITERKRAEEQLTASLKEIGDLKSALDEHAIVAITDALGKITFVNDKFCAISQYSREELLGQDHRIINSGHHPKEFIRDLWMTIAHGHVWHGEIKNRAKDGSFYWVDTTIVPFLNAHGKPRQYVAIRADITGRKRVEEALRQANESLELKVAERTGELRMAKERAESADRLKSEFLAAMSHELRTPLNGIIGFTELLNAERPGPLNPKQKQYATHVLASGRHLLQLINDVLDLAKVEAGRMDLLLETFSLEDAIAEVCASTAPLAEKKSIALRREIAAPPFVTLDRKKIKQVLFNLLSNAIKFTPDGGHVDLVVARSAPDELRLQVRDTGIGIHVEDLPKLFVEFQQIASGEARRSQGTGLGLVLTKKLVELHGGTIGVESTSGKGSTFTVNLPLHLKAMPS